MLGEPAFSPFPTVFSKGFLYRVVKNRDCVVNVSMCLRAPGIKKPHFEIFYIKTSDLSKSQVFAKNEFLAEIIGIYQREENIMGKGKNLWGNTGKHLGGDLAFSPLPKSFQLPHDCMLTPSLGFSPTILSSIFIKRYSINRYKELII